ncbi:hypothetical protein ACF0H5_021617 [Mactra antiquata]
MKRKLSNQARYYGPEDVGVHTEDILNASRYIDTSRCTDDAVLGRQQIGSELNQWVKPVTQFGDEASSWVVKLKASPFVGEIDFPRRQWARARDAVDEVLKLLLKEMRAKVVGVTHLKIDSYIRQGSARDGLKVIAPDEFDVAFEFHIERLEYVESPIQVSSRPIPGFCYIKVRNATANLLAQRYPELWRKEVFIEMNGSVFLSSKNLYTALFLPIIDQSCASIEEKIKKIAGVKFRLTRRTNPPAVNITIHLDTDGNNLFMPQGRIQNPTGGISKIDVDVIPAIRLKKDDQSFYQGSYMNAFIHGIPKWKEDGARGAFEVADQDRVWLINSVAYERHMFDVARLSEKQRYILTALRIVKTYFKKTKKRNPPPPITTILKSYHLKQIACYAILYTCHIHRSFRIDSAHKAIIYFLRLLEVCLEKKRLPHFFYSNTKIGAMFNNYVPQGSRMLRYDMFRQIPNDALQQVLYSYKNHLCPDLGIFWTGPSNQELTTVMGEMRQEASKGEYF